MKSYVRTLSCMRSALLILKFLSQISCRCSNYIKVHANKVLQQIGVYLLVTFNNYSSQAYNVIQFITVYRHLLLV